MARILVAEDVIPVRELLERMLQELGQSVTSVGDGAAALAAGLEGSFDLIILDLEMPLLDGYQVMRRLKKASVKSVIVALTGAAHEDVAYIAGRSGAAECLTKPIELNQLQQLLGKLSLATEAPVDETRTKTSPEGKYHRIALRFQARFPDLERRLAATCTTKDWQRAAAVAHEAAAGKMFGFERLGDSVQEFENAVFSDATAALIEELATEVLRQLAKAAPMACISEDNEAGRRRKVE